MKSNKLSYKISSWSFILVGFGHTLTDLASPKTIEQLEFMAKMEAFPIHILGTETNLFMFHHGFSLMMGLFLFSFGLLNLLMVNNKQFITLPTNILIVNIVVSFISVLLSIQYFFIVPIVFTTIAFLGFVTSLILKHK